MSAVWPFKGYLYPPLSSRWLSQGHSGDPGGSSGKPGEPHLQYPCYEHYTTWPGQGDTESPAWPQGHLQCWSPPAGHRWDYRANELALQLHFKAALLQHHVFSFPSQRTAGQWRWRTAQRGGTGAGGTSMNSRSWCRSCWVTSLRPPSWHKPAEPSGAGSRAEFECTATIQAERLDPAWLLLLQQK